MKTTKFASTGLSIFAVIAAIACWSPLVAQEAGAEADQAAPIPEEPANDDNNAATQAAFDESGLISMTFSDVELEKVVDMFIATSGANIICNATNLQGKVTANLKDVEWLPALRAIIERHGLSLQKDPQRDIYYIESYSDDAPEPWVTETIALNYLKSSDAAELLKSMLGQADEKERVVQRSTKQVRRKKDDDEDVEKEDVAVIMRSEGRVVSYPSGNMVVVSTTAARMEDIKNVLKSVDMPRPQVYIEAKIVELRGDAGKNVGIDWSMLNGFRVGTSDKLTRSYTKTKARDRGDAGWQAADGGAVYSYDGAAGYKRMSSASAEFDNIGSALALTAPITGNQGLSPIERVGIYTEDAGKPYAGVNSTRPGAVEIWGRNRVRGRFTSVDDISTAIFEASALSLVLSALETTDNASFVSNPKVIVANEERAIIDMTTKTPYVMIERTAGTQESPGDKFSSRMAVIPGNNEGLSFIEQAFFAYGLKLDVIPRINNSSNITVSIEPTISDSLGTYSAITEDGIVLDTGYPIINMKRVKTIFSLADRQTAVIGGLTTTRDIEITKKVPLLGDIPFLGKYLFTHTSKQKQQVETIIFVTVGIVDSDRRDMALAVPEASTMIQRHVDAEGRLLSTLPATTSEIDDWGTEVVPAEAAE